MRDGWVRRRPARHRYVAKKASRTEYGDVRGVFNACRCRDAVYAPATSRKHKSYSISSAQKRTSTMRVRLVARRGVYDSSEGSSRGYERVLDRHGNLGGRQGEMAILSCIITGN